MKTPIRYLRGSPLLFPLIYLASLSLVASSASAIAIFGREDVAQAAIQTAVGDDRSAVAEFVRSTLVSSEVATGEVATDRQAALARGLENLVRSHGLVGAALTSVHGTPIAATGDASALGDGSAAAAAPLAGTDAAIVTPISGTPLLRETVPIADATGSVRLVVLVARDASPILARADEATLQIVLITVCSSITLVVILFAIFRAANTRLKRQEDSLIESRRRDPLTDLLNHGAAIEILTDAVEASRRDTSALGIAIVDVDNFRLLNDVHGSAVGDEVLLAIRTALEAESRPWFAVARFGPDEFLVLALEDRARELSAGLGRVSSRLDEVVLQPPGAERLPISISVGIAYFPFHASNVAELISAATIALGEAKAAGGKRIVINDSWSSEAKTAYSTFDALHGLVIAIDRKDRYTKLHSEDVATYALFIAERLDLAEDMRLTLRVAGLLHDVGKIGVPDDILRKPGPLTPYEYEIMKQHVALGDLIVRDVPDIEHVRNGVRYHHERWDGKGYLVGLAGEDIPLVGRILAVADAFSAMTTTRPYRKAMSVDDALDELRAVAGTQLDPGLVDAFVRGMELDPAAPMPGDPDKARSLWKPGSRAA